MWVKIITDVGDRIFSTMTTCAVFFFSEFASNSVFFAFEGFVVVVDQLRVSYSYLMSLFALSGGLVSVSSLSVTVFVVFPPLLRISERAGPSLR